MLLDITPARIDKARACKSNEEIVAFMTSEGVELSDDQLDSVTGGTGLVQGFKMLFGPYLYPPCPCGGTHEFENYGGDDLLQEQVRCTKCGTVY